jgi:MucB/RseB N-terminal domain
VNLIPRLMRGPTGRRAVIASAVVGLLAFCLSAAEGGVDHLVHRQQARTPGNPAAAVPGRGRCSAPAAGIRLLHQAVRAARRVSYQGVQVISWQAPGGSGAWLGSGASRVRVNVWHRLGAGTRTRVTAPSRTWSDVDRGQDSPQPDGVLGVTPALIGLLCTHYAVRSDGTGSTDGRRAMVVEALRGDGTLAARFWLDSATKLPLRRELFDPQTRLVSDDNFADLILGARSVKRASADHPAASSSAGPSSLAGAASSARAASSAAAAPAGDVARPADVRIAAATTIQVPGSDPAASGGRSIARSDGSGSDGSGGNPAAAGHQPTAFRPWADRLGAAQLATLRSSGWPVPGPMPGGLTLFDARQSATAAGRVVDLAYSDGLSVVSLFMQRGRLPAELPGWHQTDVGGNRLYVSNHGEPDLTWSARGFVYTVVAGAPAPTVAAVVDALPHEAGLGFWDRMKHGLRRLWSWINPFR